MRRSIFSGLPDSLPKKTDMGRCARGLTVFCPGDVCDNALQGFFHCMEGVKLKMLKRLAY